MESKGPLHLPLPLPLHLPLLTFAPFPPNDLAAATTVLVHTPADCVAAAPLPLALQTESLPSTAQHCTAFQPENPLLGDIGVISFRPHSTVTGAARCFAE